MSSSTEDSGAEVSGAAVSEVAVAGLVVVGAAVLGVAAAGQRYIYWLFSIKQTIIVIKGLAGVPAAVLVAQSQWFVVLVAVGAVVGAAQGPPYVDCLFSIKYVAL